jgi:protoheme IX farnesyltransferase
MPAQTAQLAEDQMADIASLRDVFGLLKPGVMALVVFTGAVGLWLAPGSLHPFLQLISITAIALGSGAGAAFNMWYDRDIDAIMQRTKKRAIPSGKMAPDDVLAMSILLAIASVGLLGLASNWLAAGLLAFAIFFYAVVYTMWLKRHTAQNIVIGGAAGAFPAVIGWAAVTGEALSLMPWLLFGIVFIWTPPHFWALALYRHDDYKRANIPMLPVTAGAASTKRHIVGYSIALLLISLSPVLAGSGVFYAVCALALSSYFLVLAFKVKNSDIPRVAMRLFGYSILYLFALFSALLLDHLVRFYAA